MQLTMARSFQEHNEEQAAVWSAYHDGSPLRVPVSMAAGASLILLEPALNPRGYTFRDYFNDPAVMFEVQLQAQYWVAHNLPGDHLLGLPEEWTIAPHFENVTDAAWLGAPLHYYDKDGTPATLPILPDSHKHLLFDRGIPDPFSGILATGQHHYEYFLERAARETFHGRPIKVTEFFQGFSSDGPFTNACTLRGATDFCVDLYDDPDYARELLAYIVEATLTRRKAWCDYYGMPPSRGGLWLPDDSIAMLSCDAYRDWVLPHHQRLSFTYREPDQSINVHLCGDASRHFRLMRDELVVSLFDTGYPIDHGKIRRELGPKVTIQGQVESSLLLYGTADEVAAETGRILHSGVMEGGKFIFTAGILGGSGWLAPCAGDASRTPLDNLWVLYDTVRMEGRY